MFFSTKELVRFFFSFFLLCLVAFSTIPVNAASGVPNIFSYQGHLTDSGGNLLGGFGTPYYFKFSIWDSPTVGQGNKLWPSSAPSATSLTVKQGVFSVNIGDVANGYPDALDYDFSTNKNIYLQVEISSDNINFETLGPRSTITSSAFSQLSNQVLGTSPSVFGTTTPIINSLLSVLTTSINQVALTIKGLVGQVANLFNIQDSNGNSLFSVTAGGNVGIGTSTPSTKFVVNGDALFTGTSIFNGPSTFNGSMSVGYSTSLVNQISSGINWDPYGNVAFFYRGSYIGSSRADNSDYFWSSKDGNTYLHNGEVITSGNIGIGTSTPVAALSFAPSLTSVGGINFGDSTTNLYRNSPGSLQTDGSFVVGGGNLKIGDSQGGYFYQNAGSGIAYRGTGFQIQGPNASRGTLSFLYGSHLESPSDGSFELESSSGSGFSTLQFGGTTSSWPAFVVGNNTGMTNNSLNVMNADGSTGALFGIGTTTPSSSLTVVGDASISGNLNASTINNVTAGGFRGNGLLNSNYSETVLGLNAGVGAGWGNDTSIGANAGSLIYYAGNTTNIGAGSDSKLNGVAVGVDMSVGQDSVGVGSYGAFGYGQHNSGDQAVVIGSQATASNNAIAIGYQTTAPSNTVVLGNPSYINTTLLSGNVGIGTTTPTAQLTTTGTVRFGALTGAGATLVVDANGNVTVSSDERLKNIQGSFDRSLEDIEKINPIVFKWKPETGYDASSTYAGFSAQNIQIAIPEAVGIDNRGYLTLADRPILATAVNAIKEIGSVFVKIENGVAYLKEIVVDKLTSNQICLQDTTGQTCITKSQLDALLSNQGVSSSVPSAPVSSPNTSTSTDTTSATTTTATTTDTTTPPVDSTTTPQVDTTTPDASSTSN